MFCTESSKSVKLFEINVSNQWWIQDFYQGGVQTPKIAIIFQIFAENCMKMKGSGQLCGGVPGAALMQGYTHKQRT